MKVIFLILATATLAYGCNPSSQTQNNAQIKTGSIVGGVEVNPKTADTSFVVSIGGGCAGSIIESKWILTAAHCKSLFSRSITGGNIDLRARDRVKLKMLRSYVHPKYSGSTGSHDFALIELTSEIDFEATKLSKVDIADTQLEAAGGLDDGTMTVAYGWGLTRENGSQASVLREVDLPIVSRERANAPEAYNNEIDESMIAAGYDKGGKDSCQGDSGGPLVIRNKDDGSQTLVGVVSFGEGCARAMKYGIYSNVSYANDWIQSIINK